MGKKRSWFSFVKRIFIPETKSRPEKKSKKLRWVFGRLKFKQYPAIGAPQRTLNEATEEQKKHAFAVAMATAAAAEAAIAAAHAAAEVVKLTGVPHELGIKNRVWAAIRIQTAFRAYLARKALKALKGVVRLQAMIRGQIVRRRAIARLKSLQSITKTPPKIHHIKIPSMDESYKDGEKKQSLCPKSEFDEKMQQCEHAKTTSTKCHRNWDYSLFREEDVEALGLKRQDPVMKRERMKKYSFSYREGRNDKAFEESVTNNENERQSHQFEHLERRETKERKSSIFPTLISSHTIRTGKTELSFEELNSQFSLPRRSFCRAKQTATGENTSLPSSPVFPTYMASTESAKAKARSMSLPKQRLGLSDTYSGHVSPHKIRVSSWSSFNGEVTNSGGRSGASQLIAANMKKLYRH